LGDNRIATPTLAPKFFENARALGKVLYSISPGFDRIDLDRDEFAKLNPGLKSEVLNEVFADGDTIGIILPRVEKDTRVSFSRLKTDCPSLTKLPYPVYLTINGDGTVLDATGPYPEEGLPNSIYKCTFQGGGDSVYTSVYMPPA
jgi:hypothetical protein